MERSLIIFKPDSLNRALVGEILHRFERKGLKIIGMKMTYLDDDLLGQHYFHLKDKPFFPRLKRFMQSAPSIVAVLEGNNVIEVVRNLVGVTRGYEALSGTVRGDYSLSGQCNVIHASDSPVNAELEISRFFNHDELFNYEKIDLEYIYAEDEL
ncbi:MAG: nucleoside-diphosphate kinase [archaeon]|jgi:nucleoside-diphosphate kinase|nr:nucleoside-diphosphate kinase [archaeon]MDD2477469.1 nucleoside-diphosphate kinase [Candidatus ainarchaeum sp.]MDD3084752.1 nucleoside-diphosphate kinase [Candidatus ainarchaeum sp.]MDD4221001.1 nucleoside-diphosphate kinase [Candidatus ainarchaeum sp.]MDD4662427.1 nucleoside-diphosphate kinase [Candidatus ainarchaeum sp.]